MENYGLGWNQELEQQHVASFATLQKPMCAVGDSEIPADADPYGILSVSNQGRRNSCTGQGTDKVLEFDEWLETGNIINLSARFSYLAARTIDGSNNGPDAGASISGSALATQRMGTCLESEFPYWRDDEKFDSRIPEAVLSLASKHRVRSAVQIRSADELVKFIGSGQGGVVFGIPWTQSLAEFGGQGVLRSSGGRSGGGHAVCILGYRTMGQEKVLRLFNSHSERWGDKGTALVDPALFDRWMGESPYGAYGLSGLEAFTKRKFRGWKGLVA